MSEMKWNPELALTAGLLSGEVTNAQVIEARESLQAEDFSDLRCQAVWRMIEAMVDEGIEINANTVIRQGSKTKIEKQTGPIGPFIVECGESAPVGMCLPDILDASKRRRLLAAGAELIAAGKDTGKLVDEALAQAEELLAGNRLASVDLTRPEMAVAGMLEDLDFRIANAGKLQGIPTGIHNLDQKIDGLQLAEMTILGARPSQGKTAFGVTTVEYACFRRGYRTLFVTLEMRVPVLMRRLAAQGADISLTNLRRGNLDAVAQVQLRDFATRARKAPLFWIDASGSGIDCKRLCATIRRVCLQENIQLVVVDYLQKIHGTGSHEKRTYELGQVSTELKQCAVKTKAAFLVLAQLNRDSTKSDSRPKSHQLGDSKQIEQDADTIILIHRPENEQAVLIVDKQRDGEVGVCLVDFDGTRGRFTVHRETGQ